MTLFKLPETLEWVYNVFDESYTAKILFGELSVEPFSETTWSFKLYMADNDPDRRLFVGPIEDDVGTVAEAQANALEWYRDRLSSALVPATFADCQEACEVMIEEADAEACKEVRP